MKIAVRRIAIIAALLASPSVRADSAPVFARVRPIAANQGAELRLEQDVCYTWGPPTIGVSGTDIAVSQTVTAIPACTETRVATARLGLGTFAAGSYRVTYTPMPVGFGPMPVSIVEFNARASSRLHTEPVDPIALEPIDVHFSSLIGCDRVAGVRIAGDALRIELDRFEQNTFVCDEVGDVRVTIGALPPGTHRLEVAYLAEDGGAVIKSGEIDVRPGNPERFPGRDPLPDFSGLWFSRNEEPSTGVTFIHTRIPQADGIVNDLVIGIWYRYTADGGAVWYWTEAARDVGFRAYGGPLYAFRAANPQVPGWQRALAIETVGTMTIQFGARNQPARVMATINGAQVAFALERVRWLRSAWPQDAAP